MLTKYTVSNNLVTELNHARERQKVVPGFIVPIILEGTYGMINLKNSDFIGF